MNEIIPYRFVLSLAKLPIKSATLKGKKRKNQNPTRPTGVDYQSMKTRRSYWKSATTQGEIAD